MERPREKAMLYGVRTLSNRELLGILLRCGYQGKSSLEVADEVLKIAGGISGLPQMTYADWTQIKGIKQAKAIDLMVVFELVRRCRYEQAKQEEMIQSPQSLISWLQLELGHLKQEHFLVVFLNIKNFIIGYQTIFVGGLDHANIHPREIFKEAFSRSAAKIVLVHNHPSQDVLPSVADRNVTIQLQEVSKIMNIPIMDHLIIAQNRWFSFRQQGLLDND
ncbi:MAG: DNA repair protein RadC [Erysipelotrichaceae bacterium]|nr:DNA repair protein RadC [Erysipelotrichaceae bacterium]